MHIEATVILSVQPKSFVFHRGSLAPVKSCLKKRSGERFA
jgi:hypothetical protein